MSTATIPRPINDATGKSIIILVRLSARLNENPTVSGTTSIQMMLSADLNSAKNTTRVNSAEIENTVTSCNVTDRAGEPSKRKPM
jgi:hypothetical protein